MEKFGDRPSIAKVHDFKHVKKGPLVFFWIISFINEIVSYKMKKKKNHVKKGAIV